MAISKPTMDVYYGQGPAEYQKQMAQYKYESGEDLNASFVDPIRGNVKYADYLKAPTQYLTESFTGSGYGSGETPQYLPNSNILKEAYSGSPTSPDLLAGTKQKRTGETFEEIAYRQSLLPAAQAFANKLPQPQQTITMGQLEGATTTQMPEITDNGTSQLADATVAGAQNITVKEVTQDLTNAQKQEQSILDEMTKLVEEDTGKGAEQAKMEAEANIAQKQADLQLIVDTIASKTKEFEAYKLAQEGKPITMNSIIGNIAQKRNTIASEIAMLQGQAYIAQGQLDRAQSSIDRAIDLKYSTVENKYKILVAQLQALEPTLNRQEKERALVLQRQYEQEQQTIADQKTQEVNIQKLMLDYYSAGGKDLSVAQSISSAKTLNEAIQIYGQNAPIGLGTETTSDYKNWELAGGLVGTGQTFAEWIGKGKDTRVSPYQEERITRTLQSINELIPQINSNTTGWGAFLTGKLPASEARTFAGQLNTLKASIAFGELTAMREASKTGGALGQVSDREGKLLESALGSLDQLQSAEQLQGQLEKIRGSIERWQSALGASNNTNNSDFAW